jgi:hypothetical protein
MWKVVRAPILTALAGALAMLLSVGAFVWITVAPDTEMPGSIFVFIPPIVGGVVLVVAGLVWCAVALVKHKPVEKSE